MAAIGDPAGCVRVLAVGSHDGAPIMNQTLGPLPPGTCTLGSDFAAIDFSRLAGEQFFTICPSDVPALPRTWGSIKAAYRQPGLFMSRLAGTIHEPRRENAR